MSITNIPPQDNVVHLRAPGKQAVPLIPQRDWMELDGHTSETITIASLLRLVNGRKHLPERMWLIEHLVEKAAVIDCMVRAIPIPRTWTHRFSLDVYLKEIDALSTLLESTGDSDRYEDFRSGLIEHLDSQIREIDKLIGELSEVSHMPKEDAE